MHKLNFSYLAIFIIALAFGCSKDDSDSRSPYFEAKVDGQEFNTGSMTHQQLFTNIQINGTSQSRAESLSILIDEDDGVGTFDIAGSLFAPNGSYVNNSILYSSTTGQVTVTKLEEDWVEGTFYFTAESSRAQTVEVTEGRFGIELE